MKPYASALIGARLSLVLLSGMAVHPIPLPAQTGAATDPNAVFDPALLQAMEYRLAGPHRGGRVTAVTGVPSQPFTYYMGSTGGGVWKTTDGGQVWNNVSDGFFDVGSMGAVAVARSDPNVIYAGTGSACIRGNVSTGIGVYKSTDAGARWTHVGLRDAGQIGRIRVHPNNPDLVYAAVLGHAFGRNEQRGVFRSQDGGETWERVLFVSDSTGAVDLAMDVTNPRILYAAMWRVERKPWTLISGAVDAGIYKTADGGETWTKLTDGLPTTLVGKIGVAVSPANGERLWAVIEAAEGQSGVYRSDDAGRTWRRVNDDPRYTERPWYYNHIYADPQDENTVYVVGELLWKSVDGGRTFSEIPTPHGDNHDLWLNPGDPTIMIEGNDGGANVSFDGGRSWSPQVNQPTAEFYTVTVDDAFPYRVYGPQQDNSTISVPSRTEGTGITIQHWVSVGGCETGPVAVSRRDPNVVFAGCYGGRISRFDRATGQSRQIMVYPQLQLGMPVNELRYRFQWNAPILVSPHDANVLYHASQYVHRSTDEGQSWRVVSPDLTRNDESKQGSAGEPITHDITGVEVYGTIFALEESPHTPGVLWAGSNDGLVHISQDNGSTWNDVTPRDLPEWSTISILELSPHQPGRAFIAAYRYRLDDFQPYIFRTEDYGESWELLTDGTNGIPANHPTRVVREDPDRRGLLYAGTEFGLFVSFDDGAHWQPFQLNLPVTPVTDLQVHRQDLVVATQGRSFWILDDLTPLHQLTPAVASAPAHLFRPRTAYRAPGSQADPDAELVRDPVGGARLDRHQAGVNPPAGAIIYYAFGREPEGAALEILDQRRNVIRTFSSDVEDRDERMPAQAGLNRFVWDLTYPGAELVDDAIVTGYRGGPRAVPGSYQVRLRAGDWSATESFEVVKDPRVATTLAEFREQFDLMTTIREKLDETHGAVRTIRSVREQATDLARRLTDSDNGERIEDAADELGEKLGAVEQKLVRVGPGSAVAIKPRITSQFTWLNAIVNSADARPTDQSQERFEDLDAELAGYLAELQSVLHGELAAFNDMIRAEGVPAVILPRTTLPTRAVSSARN